MKDEQIEDLKQFIGTLVSQTETRLGQKIDAIDKKMEDGFAGVGDAIEQIHQQLERRDADIESRLAKLEQQAT